jgi:AraC-like DNA-binding protein
MDALSEVLRAVRLTGAAILNADLGAPWAIEVDSTPGLARAFLPESESPAIFHVVTQGELWVQSGADEPIRVIAGEAVLFPHGDAHRLGSDVDAKPVPIAALVNAPIAGELIPTVHGGDGPRSRIVTGLASVDRRLADPLLGSLPHMVRVNFGGSSALEQLEGALSFELTESDAPRAGGLASLARLAELVVIDIIRRYVEATPSTSVGWLAGLNDRYVGRALALMHARPGDDWTVEKLARQVHLSRSALAEQFTRLLGEPPITYLTNWRLCLAAQKLAATNREIRAIAKEAGYESAGAFSHAFKRAFGKPPTAWRRKQKRRK